VRSTARSHARARAVERERMTASLAIARALEPISDGRRDDTTPAARRME
jgi:hypothetical protein